MKSLYIAAAAFLFAAPAVAQQGDPMEAANAIDACNGSSVVSAAWQDDGRLLVACPRGSLGGEAGAAAAGGGATNFALPAILALLVGAAAVGGGGSTSGTN